ncbi:MAG: cystathionine gamma-synthase family protein [Gemmatimonadetes bacterium]|nr:cystathionine gamma-synthase family protein [Gemmatimonadota bacterium]MCC7131950.1 cystathionine gamma-synthase family protein [Gemmatimonadales bacterium]
MTDRQPSLATLTVWGGELDKSFWERATQLPIVQSASFGYRDLDEWMAVALGQAPGHIYSRNTNPTVAAFEEKVRLLEGAEAATSFATGMAAVSNTLFALLESGQRVVSVRESYGGTAKVFTDFLPRLGVSATLCDTGDHDALEREISRGCAMVYVESPTNPTIRVHDIARLARAAKAAGALLVVDNTTATPINTRPLSLGADLVLHSATKFLGGHEDAMGGVVCGPASLVQRIYHYREITGASLAPLNAYLLLRGLKTLAIRVRQQNENALAVARFLASHPAVASVGYPGLPTDPGHEIAARQMTGFGGMLCFSLKGGWPAVKRVLPRLRFAHCAASLGGVQTFVGPPATTSHVECTAEERAALGIPEGLIRYSVGIEEQADLISDLTQALASA